jgi:hypothetical protein
MCNMSEFPRTRFTLRAQDALFRHVTVWCDRGLRRALRHTFPAYTQECMPVNSLSLFFCEFMYAVQPWVDSVQRRCAEAFLVGNLAYAHMYASIR